MSLSQAIDLYNLSDIYHFFDKKYIVILFLIKNVSMVKQAYKFIDEKENYLFKNDILDVKTEKLFSIIKNVIRVIEFQKCKEDIHSIFFSLAHFADHYLKDLEITLKDTKCKSLAKQINHNKLFIDNIIKFKDDYSNGKDLLCRNLLFFIVEWAKEQKKIDETINNSLEKVY